MPDPTASTEQQPEQLRLMAVHAHPDDESSKGAATMARYVAEGVDVVVVTCTGGERGSILNPAMDRPEVLANISEIRRAEMDRAREILGIRQDWLGYVDSGLPEGWKPWEPLPDDCFGVMDPEVSAERLVEWVRRERPHVMLTYDEQGGYPHPDHIRTHDISMIAFEAAGDPTRYPDAGEPWQPLKLYYFETFHKARLMALHEAMEGAGLESHYKEWLDRWEDKPEDEGKITTRVPCGDYFEVRDRALIAHATQIDPESFWFKCPIEIQRAAWPTEDYQLARNLTSSTIPEDDLFAGVRESAGVPE